MRSAPVPAVSPLLLCLGLALWLTACSTLPARVSDSAAPPAAGRVTVSGSDGLLSAGQERRSLRRLAAEGQPERVVHHLEVLAATGDVELYRNNTARLLVDGPATFGAMKAAIRQARARIWLESYIIEDDAVAEAVAALLLDRAAGGVAVALLYDSVGSIRTPAAFFDRLKAGGVAVCAFNPVNPIQRTGHWGLDHRDHRKLLVVDNEAAYTGGINISRVYASSSFGFRSAAPAGDPLKDGWRDTQIELRGPVVPVLARIFAQTWREQGCHGELDAAPPPADAEPGERIVKVLASDPRDPYNRIYTSLLAAVGAARHSVKLTMAYFAPGDEFVQALCDAAVRGVSVELVLPGRSDFPLVLHAGRSYYARMLAAGVQIHEMDDAVMHAKTAVIDGVFATVGSSNLDWRSLVSNSELNVIVLGEDFGRDMEALFERDRKASTAVTAEAWAQRGVVQRMLELLGRAAQRWL